MVGEGGLVYRGLLSHLMIWFLVWEGGLIYRGLLSHCVVRYRKASRSRFIYPNVSSSEPSHQQLTKHSLYMISYSPWDNICYNYVNSVRNLTHSSLGYIQLPSHLYNCYKNCDLRLAHVYWNEHFQQTEFVQNFDRDYKSNCCVLEHFVEKIWKHQFTWPMVSVLDEWYGLS